MRFVNNWLSQISAALGPNDTTLSLPQAAAERLVDGEYLLTLVNSTIPAEQSAWEIVKAKAAGGYITLERGQEGSRQQAWPLGTVIFCGVTAGTLAQIGKGGGDGGGSGGAIPLRLVQMESHLQVSMDDQITMWMPDPSTPATISFPQIDDGSYSLMRLALLNIGDSELVVTLAADSAGFEGTLKASPASASGGGGTVYELICGGIWSIMEARPLNAR
ncbi:hypothetical protein [Pseudomonas rhizosphaerae]|uniref:hypothetical protein n=1 Tax=Pseudomonas rhizosphaerae TaxID=216142 RepID=UPI002B46A50C|nr:hypothetical protein [Pseudomonas rhizosphaerae]MEB2870308.1 hypothetical protein [Pseudomonas rhizosphaerae]